MARVCLSSRNPQVAAARVDQELEVLWWLPYPDLGEPPAIKPCVVVLEHVLDGSWRILLQRFAVGRNADSIEATGAGRSKEAQNDE